MGDDIPDLEVMQVAGLACCPADAVQEIKEISVYFTPERRRRLRRDVIEKVLKLRGNWGDTTVYQRAVAIVILFSPAPCLSCI
jgi:3-deoxy-D-manno-octulosonate 8-phosphate phosphatase (KDO 8-P phosphatase)